MQKQWWPIFGAAVILAALASTTSQAETLLGPSQIFAPIALELTNPLAKKLLEDPLVRRQGPVEVFVCEPALYYWAMKHPQWIRAFWNRLGVPVGEITPTKSGYRIQIDDRQSVEVTSIIEKPGINVILCRGESSSPLLPRPIRAQMLIIHRFKFQQLSDGQTYVAQQVEGRANVDGAAMRTLVAMAPKRSEQVTEISARELLGFFSLMARVLQARPDWGRQQVQAVAKRFDPHEVAEVQALLDRIEPSGGKVIVFNEDDQ